jgi:hypothetical protein
MYLSRFTAFVATTCTACVMAVTSVLVTYRLAGQELAGLEQRVRDKLAGPCPEDAICLPG